MKALVITFISAILAGTAVYLCYSGGVHIYIVTGDGAHHIGAQLTDNSQPSSPPTLVPGSGEARQSSDSKDSGVGSGGAPNTNNELRAEKTTSAAATTGGNNENSASDSSESKPKRVRRRRHRIRYRYNPYNECTCPPG